MDINFEGINNEMKGFERVWKKARKANDTGKMAAILIAFSNNLAKTSREVSNMAGTMSEVALSDMKKEMAE